MTIQDRLNELGITLPEVPAPAGAYTPALKAGNIVYTSGQLPMVDGELFCEGQLGTRAVTEKQATEAARICALNALAAAVGVIEGVNNLRRVIKVTGFVASTDNFYAHPTIINGASDLLLSVVGFDGGGVFGFGGGW